MTAPPESPAAPPGHYGRGALVAVLTTQPLATTLDYLAPEGGCHLGAFVEVPLGPRQVLGVVWGPGKGGFDLAKVRPVTRVLDVPPMRAEMQAFLARAADYTLTPLPAMLRLATRAPGLAGGAMMRKVYRRAGPEPARMTEGRARVLDALDAFGGAAVTLSELAEAAGVSPSVIKGLVKAGTIAGEDSPRDTPYPRLDPDRPGVALTEDQERAAEALRQAARAGGFSATLLKGVTGSGKTEVYLEAVAETLRAGRQALVLLPEIALTAEFIARVEARFGARPAEWHSGVTMTERRRLWRMVAEGGAELVVGARSALFLPFRDLGLIVVDEEHDSSYKQEDGVIYNARDMAVLRASLAGAAVVLASATPSLETWVNAQTGKYARLDLTTRYGAAVMPAISAIDMRSEDMPAAHWISPSLAQAVGRRLEAGEQSLLFLNRRGYAPVTLCRACGAQIGCDHCDARMVEHRFLKRLMCHQCGATKPVPSACPSCGAEGRLAPVGPGVERLAEEAAALWHGARIAILSSDRFASARALKAQIEAIAQGAADIIIGTQLVAKGHNFPLLTLVGVIDADLGLQGSDLRAAERTFQLMRQVAGRAGRAERPGEALLQTFQPEHPVIRAILSGEEERFWQAEAEERRAAGAPPFGRLAGIILSSTDLAQVSDFGRELAMMDAPLRAIGARLFGPAPAPIARIRGRHRVRLLIKAEKTAPLQAAIARWLGQFRPPSGVRVTVDIDPQSFY
ncbi:replication restart DNA helicase PriA [Meinhardsimonia xiamenensis]|jgi:primosomal protein N' (replication factor Y)|uniref:Replication restart protein PriA n=1 Tax=Meinhardsimonia xiamenensis TaxID=990712 RepID=A0A1G9CT65_9RHOB|nr:primosomal protein N' [Meinhardsimonia xiamenensis]PRX38255.1 replication restart DNA helicase PriA [Meinhardsimonia xiamenensis]SDK54818.1 replication restart DNA helicase PriA [Meinhardsimonia xiamenensis]